MVSLKVPFRKYYTVDKRLDFVEMLAEVGMDLILDFQSLCLLYPENKMLVDMSKEVDRALIKLMTEKIYLRKLLTYPEEDNYNTFDDNPSNYH